LQAYMKEQKMPLVNMLLIGLFQACYQTKGEQRRARKSMEYSTEDCCSNYSSHYVKRDMFGYAPSSCKLLCKTGIHLCYNQLSWQHGHFYTDTMFTSITSKQGNDIAQVYTNDINFTRLFPVHAKG
jgi:hypothetical protein